MAIIYHCTRVRLTFNEKLNYLPTKLIGYPNNITILKRYS